MLSRSQLIALSNFRFNIAKFQRFSTTASRRDGLTQIQYLMLLHIAGHREREWSSVGELAERLQASPHGTAALVNRGVLLGLVVKQRNSDDARCIEVHLTPKGRRLVNRIAQRHRDELQSLREVFRVAEVN